MDPWHRLPGESEREHARFQRWLVRAAGQRPEAWARGASLDAGEVREISERWCWQQRREAFLERADLELARKEIAQREHAAATDAAATRALRHAVTAAQTRAADWERASGALDDRSVLAILREYRRARGRPEAEPPRVEETAEDLSSATREELRILVQADQIRERHRRGA